ncbi:MAG: DNA replication/repair protein RecF [Clostridiales bacterium]|jgi:DNA replication and repair protein RecF|nr:DNA replication/repair protein RecF [Clostridiales bacterium]
MVIETLTLSGFRNYERERAELSRGLNIFKGDNAAGKTNLLESVYVSGVGKSLKTTQDKEMVRWGSGEAIIKVVAVHRFSRHEIEIRIDLKGKKRVLIDGIPQIKMSELLGYVGIVFFSPDELSLIKDGPSERRRFMDISLCQQSKAYLKSLSLYNKALFQRNKLLKSSYSKTALNDLLDAFDVQLSKSGAAVVAVRQKFIANISSGVAEWHKKISGGLESLGLGYETRLECGGLTDIQAAAAFLERYKADREKDIETAFTNAGPHRDDLRVIVNGIDVRKFGSQGQQRSAALSLKLAEIGSFRLETGEEPILLLDDVLSELDLARQANLIEATKGVQTILTCTHFDAPSDLEHKEFIIKNGKIAGRT